VTVQLGLPKSLIGETAKPIFQNRTAKATILAGFATRRPAA
jgi:hypothetical protein